MKEEKAYKKEPHKEGGNLKKGASKEACSMWKAASNNEGGRST